MYIYIILPFFGGAGGGGGKGRKVCCFGVVIEFLSLL